MSKKNKKMAQKQNLPVNDNIIQWQIKERKQHDRNRTWYIVASVIALSFITYALWTHNFFFALIIIMAAFIIVFMEQEEPLILDFSIEPSGIRLGNKFYEYKTFKSFSVVYRPEENVRNLYLEFENTLRPRLSIPLEKTNPLEVRTYLLKRILEDLDRTDVSLSESLARMLKL